MVNSEFSRILTLLRKEKGVSQKAAALPSLSKRMFRELAMSFLFRMVRMLPWKVFSFPAASARKRG